MKWIWIIIWLFATPIYAQKCKGLDTVPTVSGGLEYGLFKRYKNKAATIEPQIGIHMNLSGRNFSNDIGINFVNAKFPKLFRRLKSPCISYAFSYRIPKAKWLQANVGVSFQYRMNYDSFLKYNDFRADTSYVYSQNSFGVGPYIQLNKKIPLTLYTFLELGISASYAFDVYSSGYFTDKLGSNVTGRFIKKDRLFIEGLQVNFHVAWGKIVLPHITDDMF